MTGSNDTKAPQEKVCGYEYTVKRGDSFYLIAHRLGVPLRDLLEANSEINPARLMVGDVLCIPMEEDDKVQEMPEATPEAKPETVPETMPEAKPETKPTPQPVPEEEDTTEDEMDDGMLDQPAVPGNPMDEAMSVCPEDSRYTVTQGETIADIQINAGLNLHTLQIANPNMDLETLQSGQVLCVPDQNVPCQVPTTYTLRQEDTLESVALRYNVSVGALLRANPCLAPADFMSGAAIVLPDGAHS